MPRLWLRDWELQVGTVLITPGAGRIPLDIAFEVTKDSTRAPNTAAIQVYNLSPARRASITTPVQISLKAGYKDLTSTIFVGRARDIGSNPGIFSQRSDTDVITTFEAKDGGTGYTNGRIETSFGAGVPILTVLKAAVEALGVGLGNLESTALTLTGGADNYPEGTVLSGPARNEVNRVVSSCGLRWSIQDGNFQLQRGSQPVETRAITLSPSTGLIGSPSKGADSKVNAQAMLIPGLYPSRVVVLESTTHEGNYQVKSVRYVGDTFGGDWLADLVLEEY